MAAIGHVRGARTEPEAVGVVRYGTQWRCNRAAASRDISQAGQAVATVHLTAAEVTPTEWRRVWHMTGSGRPLGARAHVGGGACGIEQVIAVRADMQDTP